MLLVYRMQETLYGQVGYLSVCQLQRSERRIVLFLAPKNLNPPVVTQADTKVIHCNRLGVSVFNFGLTRRPKDLFVINIKLFTGKKSGLPFRTEISRRLQRGSSTFKVNIPPLLFPGYLEILVLPTPGKDLA